MKYRTLYPILHSGQPIPVGAVFSGTDAFGKKEKSQLDIERLLAKARIEAVPELGPDTHPPAPTGEPGKPDDKGKEPRR